MSATHHALSQMHMVNDGRLFEVVYHDLLTVRLKRFLHELKENKEPVLLLKEQMKKGMITLVYAAKDEEHNEALVLLNEVKK